MDENRQKAKINTRDALIDQPPIIQLTYKGPLCGFKLVAWFDVLALVQITERDG